MTNPLDGSDFFRILAITPVEGFDPVSNPFFNVTVKTFPGLDYEFELDDGLVFPGPPATTRRVEIAETGKFIETVTVTLRPGKDFLRAIRK